MTERLAGILALFGRDVRIIHGGQETAAKAFLSPVISAADSAPYAVTDLGTADDRKWRLVTRAALADGDSVACGGNIFRIRSCAPVYVGKEFSHYEGILTKIGE